MTKSTLVADTDMKLAILKIENRLDADVLDGVITGYEVESIYKDENGVMQAEVHIDPVVSARNITINIYR